MLVETLPLPQLPLALELRCLLLGPLDSPQQLHLQERLDLPLGNRRTRQPPLGDGRLPNHLQLGHPHRLQGHHPQHFPHPRALLAGQLRLPLWPLLVSSATLAITHNKDLLTRFLSCGFFQWRCLGFRLAISIVWRGFFWRIFRRGKRISWWSKHRWCRWGKHRHGRVARGMWSVPGPWFCLAVPWQWSLVIHSLGYLKVSCVVSLQSRFWRKTL